MSINDLLNSINEEIAKLQRARMTDDKKVERGKLAGSTPHSGIYLLSPAAREKISAAQKARWAKPREEKESKIKRRIVDASNSKLK